MNKAGWILAVALGTVIAFSPALRAEDKPARPERPAPGQGPGPGQRGEAAKERLAKISEELGLSEEQKTKVRDAMKEQAEKMRELRDLEPEARREKMQELRGEMNARMKEILTAEQYAKWEKLRDEMRPGRPGGPGAGGPQGPGNRKGPKGEKPDTN